MSDIIRSLSASRQGWSPGHEKAFQSWYAAWADRSGLDPNPDHPDHRYDYRAAWAGGAQPSIDPNDDMLHWPSKYKHDDHPNRFINGVDTRTGGRP
jgi:hypothetical protein